MYKSKHGRNENGIATTTVAYRFYYVYERKMNDRIDRALVSPVAGMQNARQSLTKADFAALKFHPIGIFLVLCDSVSG